MKTVLVSAALLSALLPFEALAAPGPAPATAHVYPADAQPFGESYEEWSAEWWQWALPIPVDSNPIMGAPCDVDQSGHVFFLAGTAGGAESRTCAVPVGKALFFPLLNANIAVYPDFVSSPDQCAAATSEERLQETAEWIEGLDVDLILEIDGVAVDGLEEYKFRSDTYTSSAPEAVEDRFCTCSGPIQENPCGVPVGSPRPTISTGYWAMLRPLSPGHHDLRFGATVYFGGGGSFSTEATYDLIVTP